MTTIRLHVDQPGDHTMELADDGDTIHAIDDHQIERSTALYEANSISIFGPSEAMFRRAARRLIKGIHEAQPVNVVE